MDEQREEMAAHSTDAQGMGGDAPLADVLKLLELLGPAGAARDPLETLRDARACAQALVFDDLDALATPAEWMAARSSPAAVRLSSDAFGNEYFARAPVGEPLGAALGVVIRLAISCAVGRLRESASVSGRPPSVPIDREVSLILGEPVHDWEESPWDRATDDDEVERA